MTESDAQSKAARYWWEKAHASLASAHREFASESYSFAINRLYYAAFYAVSAALLEKGKQFSKHSGVKAAFHRDLINSGSLDKRWSEYYTGLFENRHEADYLPFIVFDPKYVAEQLALTEEFLGAIESILLSLQK